MDDDLNTPAAIAALMEVANKANKATEQDEQILLKSQLLSGGQELGLLAQPTQAWFAFDPSGAIDKDSVEQLVAERNEARASKNWARADEIRDRLAEMGVQIKDGPEGTEWRVE